MHNAHVYAPNNQNIVRNQRIYSCDECDKSFRNNGHLAKHYRSSGHALKLEDMGVLTRGTSAKVKKNKTDLMPLIDTSCSQTVRHSWQQLQ